MKSGKNIVPFWMKVFIIGSILFLLISGILFFKAQRSEQQLEVENRLMNMAILKSNQISQWRVDKLNDASVLMERPDLIESVHRFLLTNSKREASLILKALIVIKERYQFTDIFVVDPQKQIRLNIAAKTTKLCKGYESTLENALSKRAPVWTPLHMGPEYPFPHLSIVIPLFSGQEARQFTGALVLISDATQFLYPLIQSWPTPSKTAETLLIRKDGNDVLFLNELRHQENTALKLRIPLSRADLPAAMAVSGKTGVVEGRDYRGVNVVAAIMPVPDSEWFMVAKLDEQEAFVEWHYRSFLILVIMIGTISFVFIGWFVIYQRNLKKYYRRLYGSERELRQALERYGITLHAIGDAVIATDHTGVIEMMNPVAENLTGWPFEHAQGRDLSDVFRIVNEETKAPVKNPVSKVLSEGHVINLANNTLLITRDGREIPIADSGAPIRDENNDIIGVVLVFRDQTEERRIQRFIDTRLSLINYASDHSLDELLTFSIDQICDLFNSPIGFYHFVEPDQKTLSLQQWSTRTLKEFCTAQGKGMHYAIDQAGVWVDCVHEKKPVIHNDYASLTHKKGIPSGHAEIVRELVVPVIRNEKVVAIFGVGNKQTDYTQIDADAASHLADVTWEVINLKRAEDMLRTSLDKFEKTFKSSPVWVVLTTLEDGRYIEVNNAFLKTMGYASRDDVIGKTSLELNTWVDPHDRERIKDLLKKDEAVRNIKVLRRTHSGEILDTLYSAETLSLEDEQIIIAVTLDITKQKRAEALQKKTESVYTALFENINTAVAVYQAVNDGEDFIFVDFNKTAEKIDNISRNELIGKSVLEVFSSIKDFGLFDIFQRVWKTGTSEHFPVKQYKDDRIFGWRENFVYKSPSGEIVSVYTDETERMQDYENLLQSEERQRSILDAIYTGIFIIDAQTHKIVEANPAAVEMTGTTRRKIIGAECYNFICPKTPEECPVKDPGETIYNAEEIFVKANGDTIPVLKTITPIVFGEREYFLESIVDITGRKKLESQLQQAQKMESIGRLAGGVAHDYNNMLSVIIGNAQLALLRSDIEEQIHNDLLEIIKAAERSANITRQLLTFARKQTIDPKVLDLNVTIEKMLQMLRKLIGEHIELIWKPGKIWHVIIDPNQIDQLLANLCINAQDAISGYGKISIETKNDILDEAYCAEHTGYNPGEYVVLTVSDDGCGMDNETLNNIFEPFFTTKSSEKGTGLGLSTVHGIIMQNNGFINVYSEPGKGSSFKIFLPRYYGERDADVDDIKQETPKGRGETILIVEDEPLVLNVSKRMLDKLNYTVLTATGANEALQVAKEFSEDIHLMLTDVVMPETSGKDLANEIIKIYPDIKIIFMSGYPEESIAYHGKLDKGLHFIQKPFNAYSLSKKLREVLDDNK